MTDVEKKKFKRKEHVPFTRYPVRCKDMDGIYISKCGQYVHMVKNVTLVGLVDGETNEPYASYRCSINSTSPHIGRIKKVLIDDLENWDKVLELI